MAAGATRRLRDESTTAAATALVVLLTGYAGDSGMLLARLLDTMIGIGVGLWSTSLVWPPLHDRSAARRVDRIDDELGALLGDMARRLREGGASDDAEEWIQRTRDVEHDIDDAWAIVRQVRESGRLNPRRGAAARVGASEDFEALLARLEQATAEIRSMARTMGGSTGRGPLGPGVPRAWIELLRRTGQADAGRTGRLSRCAATSRRPLTSLGRRGASRLQPEPARCSSTCATSPTRWASRRRAARALARAPDPRADATALAGVALVTRPSGQSGDIAAGRA